MTESGPPCGFCREDLMEQSLYDRKTQKCTVILKEDGATCGFLLSRHVPKGDPMPTAKKPRGEGGLQYFINPQAQSSVESSVFYILEGGEGVGMGVFFSERQAVTCDHNLTERHSVGTSVNITTPVSQSNLSLRVLSRHPDLDCAILESDGPHCFVQPWEEDATLLRGTDLVLASFRIGIEEDAPLFSRRLGFARASAMSVSEHRRFLMFDCRSFAGDSGAALVLQDGRLVAIHQLVANQLRENLERKKLLSGRLDEVELSLNKLVGGGTSQACCGLLSQVFAQGDT